jgi:hypothetical protein
VKWLAPAAALIALLTSHGSAETESIDFEPRVGVIGSRVTVKTPLPEGVLLRFGPRPVTVFKEGPGVWGFIVPASSSTSFLEFVKGDKLVARSAVPFIVTGASVVAGPAKLIGLKEAIDVFGYSDPRPEGGGKPETTVRPILKFDEDEILTIGQPVPYRLAPAVELGDSASAATRGMGPAGFLITARPPKKKVALPTPTPAPPATPAE